jgi:hypothetical protein
VFHVFYNPPIRRVGETVEEAPGWGRGADLLGWALDGFGHRQGFSKSLVVAVQRGGFDWSATIEAVNQKTAGDADAEEPATGNAAVRVYPVRTILSRSLFGNVDCVVDLETPFDEHADGTLQPAVEKALKRYVADLELKEEKKILFRVRHSVAGKTACDRFVATTSVALAKALGFEERVVSQTFSLE